MTTATPRTAFEPQVGSHLAHDIEHHLKRWAFAPFDMWSAWATSWFSYASNLWGRGATPHRVVNDVARFWSVATARPDSTWSTDHTVVTGWPIANLLDFSLPEDATAGPADQTPLLILPPQAGHNSKIVDFTPAQSQVRTAHEAGLTRVFVLEWLAATDATQGTTIDDYIAVMDETLEAIGGRAHLVGNCQGGWLATIYAALRPGAVASLAIGAAPIDFAAGSGPIVDGIQAVPRHVDSMRPYRMLVDLAGGNHAGQSQLLAFKAMEPAGEVQRLASVWANIGDEAYIARHLDFVSWFETVQDMPGAFYLWAVEHLFVNNELVRGELEIGGERVDLGRITAPVFLLAGTRDHITPPEQVWALAEHVGTPEADIHGRFVEAGHLGLFMGRKPLAEHWSQVFARMAVADITEPGATAGLQS